MANTATRVFGVAELLEAILLEVPLGDLTAAAAVNHEFQNAINGNQTLHRRLRFFDLPIKLSEEFKDPENGSLRKLGQAETILHPVLQEHASELMPGYYSVSRKRILELPHQHAALAKLICQPYTPQIIVHGGKGKKVKWFAEESCTEKREGHGITLGDLVETVKLVRDRKVYLCLEQQGRASARKMAEMYKDFVF